MTIQDFFIRTGTLVTILLIVTIVELVKRAVYVRWPGLRKIKGPLGVVYPSEQSRVWHGLWLHILPIVVGGLVGCVRVELLWDSLKLTDSVLIGIVLGNFSAFFVRFALKVLPTRAGITLDPDALESLTVDIDTTPADPKPPVEPPR